MFAVGIIGKPKEEVVTDCEILRALGHSGVKAAEIVLDGERGNAFALQWIKRAKQAYEKQTSTQKETK